MSQPKLITKPFASDALPGYVNEIPKENPSGAPEQNASWSVGFPPITMTGIDDGGLPPNGEDMNGVLRAITQHNLFIGGGGVYKFTNEYISEVGGYSKGAVLISDDKTALWMSTQDNNTQNFNGSTKTQWRRIAFTELDSTLASIQSALDTKADKSVTITAGDGLIGGGTLAGNRVLAVNSSVVRTDRTITAGAGLSGGGNLSANRTLSVNYGTTSGTAAQGNDSRITGAAQKSANLSDIANAGAARQNLGLGTAATRDVGISDGEVMEVGAGGILTGDITNWDDFATAALNQGVRTEMGSGVNLNNPYGIYDAAGRAHHFAFGNPSYLAGLFCDGDDGTEDIKLVFYAYSAVLRRRFAVLSHSGNLKQSTGQETMYSMSQKAVTDAINNSAIGVGQTWQDMAGSRSWGTTYTNTTGRPIQVFISTNKARLTVNGVNFVTGNVDGEFSVVVPNGATYSASGDTAIDSGRWMELR